ncbi:MAG: HD-GYP domain-containing protein [Pelosinus sp.]|nr:HD-GYP domain-containing protein [Pelosinus sp.]
MSNLLAFDDLHEMVNALTTALDAKSHYTSGHSERVAEFSVLLAQGLGLSFPEQQRIHIGAHLHDIGKIGIPDAVLNKAGRLTEQEFAEIRQHPVIGAKIVGQVKVLHGVVDIVRFHHERFDGKGYPEGLIGSGIPLGARIVAVADAFDAMISSRPYRTAYTFEKALAEIKLGRGSQFDPVIADVLLDMHSKGMIYSKVN